VRLVALRVSDLAERWEELGFEVISGMVLLPGVRVELGAERMSAAIEGVSELAGLALHEPEPLAPVYSSHPNRALGVDHIVAFTPHFDRTTAELEQGGLPLKRIRDAGGFRQGFRRVGGPILEIVENVRVAAPEWWGLTVIVPALDDLPADLISAPKTAVQPGRMIATARSPGTPLAFITPAS
jgi:hypothetical protein